MRDSTIAAKSIGLTGLVFSAGFMPACVRGTHETGSVEHHLRILDRRQAQLCERRREHQSKRVRDSRSDDALRTIHVSSEKLPRRLEYRHLRVDDRECGSGGLGHRRNTLGAM